MSYCVIGFVYDGQFLSAINLNPTPELLNELVEETKYIEKDILITLFNCLRKISDFDEPKEEDKEKLKIYTKEDYPLEYRTEYNYTLFRNEYIVEENWDKYLYGTRNSFLKVLESGYIMNVGKTLEYMLKHEPCKHYYILNIDKMQIGHYINTESKLSIREYPIPKFEI
jgi:hypothetical protein